MDNGHQGPSHAGRIGMLDDVPPIDDARHALSDGLLNRILDHSAEKSPGQFFAVDVGHVGAKHQGRLVTARQTLQKRSLADGKLDGVGHRLNQRRDTEQTSNAFGWIIPFVDSLSIRSIAAFRAIGDSTFHECPPCLKPGHGKPSPCHRLPDTHRRCRTVQTVRHLRSVESALRGTLGRLPST